MGKLSLAGYIEIVSKSKIAIDVQKKAGSLFSRKLKALVKNWSCHWKLLYFREVLPGGFPLSYVYLQIQVFTENGVVSSRIFA